MSPSDGTGRPAPSGPPRGEKCATCGLTRWEERQVAGWVSAAEAELAVLHKEFDAETERLVALVQADADTITRWANAASNQRERAVAAEAERDELRARLTVVEAERDAARESVAELSNEFLHAAKISSTVRHARKVVAAMDEQFPSLLVRADDAEAALAACREQNTTLREALEAVRREGGKVCDGYELCDHIACHSSYAAWVIADAALASLPPVRPAGSTDNENGDENG